MDLDQGGQGRKGPRFAGNESLQEEDGSSIVSFGDALLYGGLTFSKAPGISASVSVTSRLV